MRTFVVMLAGIGIIGLTATGELAAQSAMARRLSRRRFVPRTADSLVSGNWSARKPATRTARLYRAARTAMMRRPFRVHRVRPGRLHERQPRVAQTAGVCGWQGHDAAGRARRDGRVQLVLGIVRGERSPRHRHASDIGALSPAFAGTNQERQFTFSGNQLTLRPPTAANGDQRTLTWERVPDLPDLTPTHRKLIGFWKLISFERRSAKGELLSSYPGMTGFIVYTASGHVMVHMMQPYRRRNVGASPTPDETMATYRSYTSYFGPYTVNESEKYVVHHLAAAINSGAAGTDFQRFIEFAGKRLTLKPPVTKDSSGESVQTAITWERLSD